MNLKTYLRIDDSDRARFEELYARYRMLHAAPQQCRPMIIISTPVDGLPTWEERLADPLVMLAADLDQLRPHLELQDDRVPTVRVQFGTAQVAAAFGCRIVIPENNLPAAGDHVLARAEDVYGLALPALDAGWYGKLAGWTAIWQEHLPEGVHIQHPDIQSAFNSAHLIRGNDILTDFYDHPAELDLLLDKVTDFMVAILKHTKAAISDDPDWFFDWGALWKGAARISNCSMHMISPRSTASMSWRVTSASSSRSAAAACTTAAHRRRSLTSSSRFRLSQGWMWTPVCTTSTSCAAACRPTSS